MQIVQAAVEGIVTATDRTLLAGNGGHICFSLGRALSLLQRMGYVRRKGTTQKSGKFTEKDFLNTKSLFIKDIYSLVHAQNIPSGLILNWDQTGICLVPSADYTIEQQGASRAEMACLGNKKQVTVSFAVSMSGKFLQFQGKTERCHPLYRDRCVAQS